MLWAFAPSRDSTDTVVSVDFETTGLDPETDRVVSYAAWRFVNGVEADYLEEFVDPEGVAVSEGAFKVNGITEQDLIGAHSWEYVSADLEDITKGALVVGHRLPFDSEFWRLADLRHRREPPKREALCTKVLAAAAGYRSTALEHLIEQMKLDYNVKSEAVKLHNASYDAWMCGRLAIMMVEHFGGYQKARDAHDLFCARGTHREIMSVIPVSHEKIYQSCADWYRARSGDYD